MIENEIFSYSNNKWYWLLTNSLWLTKLVLANSLDSNNETISSNKQEREFKEDAGARTDSVEKVISYRV